jgi:hypothetical protein
MKLIQYKLRYDVAIERVTDNPFKTFDCWACRLYPCNAKPSNVVRMVANDRQDKDSIPTMYYFHAYMQIRETLRHELNF